jgi:phospholipid/cholesterol/gamma-HCH transport system substrate-binding protein
MIAAIRKRSRDFIAILSLFVAALGVGGYILSAQRLSLPGWVPILGQDFFTLRGEFSTAQAVTPGQGQTVDIAGVKVGEISSVELANGRAIVTMKIEPRYAAVYHDAHMLLRPKTGLKDMIVELSPGTPTAGKLRSGETVPIQNTLPDINPDEILASLDGDTRAYLRLLLGGAGQGLRGNAQSLSSDFRRFAPTARDVRTITALLAQRQASLRHVVHNFQLLSTELSAKDAQIASFVDSSNAVFGHLASQDANIQSTLALLPGTLADTSAALGKTDRLARALGPTLQALRPTARALGPALVAVRPFLRESTPIVRDKLRPFTRAARPTVAILRPATRDLAAVSPALTTTFRVLNYAVNELAFKPRRPGPSGGEEGFLFWTAWANHAGNSVFATQDAHGPVRHGLFIASCAALGLLPQVAAANPALATLLALTNIPRQSSVCPTQTGTG